MTYNFIKENLNQFQANDFILAYYEVYLEFRRCIAQGLLFHSRLQYHFHTLHNQIIMNLLTTK